MRASRYRRGLSFSSRQKLLRLLSPPHGGKPVGQLPLLVSLGLTTLWSLGLIHAALLVVNIGVAATASSGNERVCWSGWCVSRFTGHLTAFKSMPADRMLSTRHDQSEAFAEGRGAACARGYKAAAASVAAELQSPDPLCRAGWMSRNGRPFGPYPQSRDVQCVLEVF